LPEWLNAAAEKSGLGSGAFGTERPAEFLRPCGPQLCAGEPQRTAAQ
jgi:hypothetical protein